MVRILKYITVGLLAIFCLLLISFTVVVAVKNPFHLGKLIRVDVCFIIILVLTYKKWFGSRNKIILKENLDFRSHSLSCEGLQRNQDP
jgi:hypothetical protein